MQISTIVLADNTHIYVGDSEQTCYNRFIHFEWVASDEVFELYMRPDCVFIDDKNYTFDPEMLFYWYPKRGVNKSPVGKVCKFILADGHECNPSVFLTWEMLDD